MSLQTYTFSLAAELGCQAVRGKTAAEIEIRNNAGLITFLFQTCTFTKQPLHEACNHLEMAIAAVDESEKLEWTKQALRVLEQQTRLAA